ncbi:MAG: hypothetical protein ABJN84_16750 [Flavobacteriaceae bacterium]
MKFFLALNVFLICFSAWAQEDRACNCCSEDHLAFDFWIGNWEVSNARGVAAGKSSIVREERGCVIREKWTSVKLGYTGTSLNFYNGITKQWEQLWVDNAGTFLKLKGNRVGDSMILSSDEFVKDGKNYKNRITWTRNKDGTVRQLWEVLDGDEVDTILFDGLYTRK